MRELLAKWMAALTGLLVCILAVLFALIQNQDQKTAGSPSMVNENFSEGGKEMPAPPIRDKIDLELGRTVYVILKCGTCHSVAGEGNRRNPLDGVGKRLRAGEIREWIVSPGDIDPDIRKPDYSYLSQDQLDLLVNYIQSLK